MDFDALVAAATVHTPRVSPVDGVKIDVAGAKMPAPVARRRSAPVVPTPRRLELSFHEDLNVLMTRVIDAQTGDLVREFPSSQVLDIVADVMMRMRAREEV